MSSIRKYTPSTCSASACASVLFPTPGKPDMMNKVGTRVIGTEDDCVLWKQSPAFLCGKDSFNADGHRCRSVRDLGFLRSFDHDHERLFQDAEEAVHRLGFIPEELLKTLNPLEVTDNHSACIAENVRDDEHVVPALVQDQVRRGRCRPICRSEEHTSELQSLAYLVCRL